MGQYWKLLNVSQRAQFNWHGGIKLGEILFWHDPARLTSLFRIPHKPKPHTPLLGGRYSKDPRDLGQLNLPFDILDMIFDSIPEDRVPDLVCLTMTNTLLLPIGQKWIYVTQRMATAFWKYDRIVCIGDYLDGDDLPPNLLYESEKGELSGNICGRSSRLYRHGSRGVVPDHLSRDLYWRGRTWSDVDDPQYWQLSRIEQKEYRQLVEPDYSWDGRPETEWILCNWNTGEYIRENAVAELSTSLFPLWNRDLTLGHVLLTQICWSADPSTSMRWSGPIHHGHWAGKRFVITGKDRLADEPQLRNTTWTDVTDQILDEVKAIWASEYGPKTDTEGDGLEASDEDPDGVSNASDGDLDGASKAQDSADGEDSNDVDRSQEQKDTKEATA